MSAVRPLTLLLILALSASCGGDSGARSEADTEPAADDTTPVETGDARDTHDEDGAPETSDDTATNIEAEAEVEAEADAAGDGDASPSDARMSLHAAVAVPGKLVAVRVDAPTPISGIVAIGATEVRLHHGRGVLTTTPEAAADLHLATRAWDAASDLRIDGERVVAAGETLRLAAGTRVLMGKDARLVVDGTLVAEGTAALPVLFTPDGPDAWAAIEVRAGGKAELHETWLVGGGADQDRFAGHSHSDPVVAGEGGELAMEGGGVVDAVGKAFYTEGSTIALTGVTVARCDTGGEHVQAQLTMRGAWVFEIPDSDGVFADDDNDGIYCFEGTVLIEDSVFAFGEDDAIDQNGADLEVRRVLIDGFRHEGIATSNGGKVTIEEAFIQNVAQGIECGYGAPDVRVSHVSITACDVGLRWGDEYPWDALGTLQVDHALVLGNGVGVKADDPQEGAAPVGAVAIRCSAVATEAWNGVSGNIADAPATEPGCWPTLSACNETIGASGASAGPLAVGAICEP